MFMKLSDLKTVHKALKANILQAQEQAKQAQAAALASKRKAITARELFLKAIGPVKPLAQSQTAAHLLALQARPAPLPIAHQAQKDDQAALEESLSDEWDVENLLETDESLSYRQAQIGVDVIRKLRRGTWSIQGELDLHNLRTDEARTALSAFIKHAKTRGWRCIRVIHGKGNGSLGKAPVLKNKVQRWLVQKIEVLAFVQAKAADGGRGALVVLLS
jgi:DNA-nicking Smr family endonuclease